jgi:xanthine/CO dehydrogenase XdhC/CoxF family maturation factor
MTTLNDVQPQVDQWLASGEPVALATVVKVWGSAPRPRGSKMAISASGGIAGSVSGGCVEGAVVDVAQEVLRTGEARLVSYGVADELAFTVGLSCGGEIDVFVEPITVN